MSSKGAATSVGANVKRSAAAKMRLIRREPHRRNQVGNPDWTIYIVRPFDENVQANPCELRLQILAVTLHVVCFENLIDKHKPVYCLADRGSLRRIRNPGVGDTRSMQAKEVVVLSEEDSAFEVRLLQILRIGSAEHARFGDCK